MLMDGKRFAYMSYTSSLKQALKIIELSNFEIADKPPK